MYKEKAVSKLTITAQRPPVTSGGAGWFGKSKDIKPSEERGKEILRRFQQWLSSGGVGAGTGTRGSTLFPITGGTPNASLGERYIKIVIRRYSGDDKISFANASFDAYMRITEIGA